MDAAPKSSLAGSSIDSCDVTGCLAAAIRENLIEPPPATELCGDIVRIAVGVDVSKLVDLVVGAIVAERVGKSVVAVVGQDYRQDRRLRPRNQRRSKH